MILSSRLIDLWSRAICGSAATICLLSPLQQVAAQASSTARDTLRPFQPFRTTVLSVDTSRIVLSVPKRAGTRELRLPARLLRPLVPLRGRSFNALAEEQPTPGGPRAAVMLRDGATLRAVAELVRDIQLLQPAERGGIAVELRPAQNPRLLYEDNCKVVYNVPTAFTLDGEQVLVEPFETRTVRVRGGSYTISLASSQFVVLKSCSTVFEGSRSLIEYVIVRNS